MNIGYIIKTKKNMFKAFVGTPIKDDDDSFINILAAGIKSAELSEVQEFIENHSQGIDKLFINPVNSSMTGITWLSELKEAQKNSLLSK